MAAYHPEFLDQSTQQGFSLLRRTRQQQAWKVLRSLGEVLGDNEACVIVMDSPLRDTSSAAS